MSQSLQKSQALDAQWYAMFGFNIDNKDETGFLSMSKSREDRALYEIVDSIDEAMKFPSINIYSQKGFGTPKQWLEFFKGEPELVDWKFHLVKTTPPLKLT